MGRYIYSSPPSHYLSHSLRVRIRWHTPYRSYHRNKAVGLLSKHDPWSTAWGRGAGMSVIASEPTSKSQRKPWKIRRQYISGLAWDMIIRHRKVGTQQSSDETTWKFSTLDRTQSKYRHCRYSARSVPNYMKRQIKKRPCGEKQSLTEYHCNAYTLNRIYLNRKTERLICFRIFISFLPPSSKHTK